LRDIDDVNAVVAETVVGTTTGVVPAPKGYFKGSTHLDRIIIPSLISFPKAMKSVCDKYGALFILDEVGLFSCSYSTDKSTLQQIMSGMGRTCLMDNNLLTLHHLF
jgi:hypothetical protein